MVNVSPSQYQPFPPPFSLLALWTPKPQRHYHNKSLFILLRKPASEEGSGKSLRLSQGSAWLGEERGDTKRSRILAKSEEAKSTGETEESLFEGQRADECVREEDAGE